MSREEAETSLALKNFRPRLRIDPLMRPIQRFLDIEASGGIVLIVATMIALFLANTSLASWYASIWENVVKLELGSFKFEISLLHLINDGLMTLFFFVVGLEIKQEIAFGELRTVQKALFPIVAAVGGMLVPAAIFLGMRWQDTGLSGWAIPMATDIAFVVGFLSLFGRRVPTALKISLLTLAIADDIGAVIVIALAYAHGFSREFFLSGVGFFVIVLGMNAIGIRRTLPYVIVGLVMWYCFYRSGVHPTLAGVLLGLATPSRRLVNANALTEFLRGFQNVVEKERAETSHQDREALRAIGRESVSPLERLATDLHPWVAFLVMPLFALANAGVPVELTALESGVAWAVILGLLIGKPLGIFGFAWIADAMKFLPFPRGISPRVFFAASCLCGVGFTMSLFIAGLGLQGELLTAAKSGVLLGSAFSAAIGLVLLHRFLERKEREDEEG